MPGAAAAANAAAATEGRACRCCKQGFNVVGLDLVQPDCHPDSPWLPAAASPPSAQQQRQQQVAWLQADLSQPEAVLTVPDQLAALGVAKLHLLVHNAAIADPYMQSDSLAARAAAWSRFISVNLTAPFLLTEALLPLLVDGEASIVHVSSTRALQSEPHTEGYAASKAGLLGLAHAQAASLASRRVRVNAVLPGWINTSPDEHITPEQHDWHWAGRVGQPHDVAHLVGFLADAAFITGQQFVVDGGVTRRMVYPE